MPIKHGTHAYAEKAEVMLWAYAGADDEPRVWDLLNGTDNYLDDLSGTWVEERIEWPGAPTPLFKMLNDQETLVWYQNGGAFDFVVLDKKKPWFTSLVPLARRRDTMVQAFAHALPGSLEKMGAIFDLVDADRKLVDEGRRLIRLFCIPKEDGTYNDKQSHPKDWQRFIEYAARDITTMRAAHRLMPTWNYKAGKQMDLWHCDLRIQSRGFAVDTELATKAIEAAEKAKAAMARRTHALTDGAVEAATQRDKLLEHILNIHGVDLPDMRADTLERRIDDPNLPIAVKELLGIRLQASMNSPAKYGALLRGVSSDGRLRGCAQFRGAGRTGRWAHRMFQPGNLPRPLYPWSFIETGIYAIKTGGLDLVVDNEMAMCASAIRGCIIAPPGKKLVIADLSNIEGRVAAWLAGEDWKVQAFRDYDTVVDADENGKPVRAGPDLYLKSYAGSFNVAVEDVTKDQRQIGKVQELMFQYGGGVGAWLTGAASYGIDLGAMTEAVYDTLPQDVIDEAQNFLEWLYEQQEIKRIAALGKLHREVSAQVTPEDYAAKVSAIDAEFGQAKARHYLAEKVFITCDSLKRLWRRAHPMISSYWKDLEETVRDAIGSPGVTFDCRKLKVRRDGTWLRIALPSGRALCYPSIRLSKHGDITYTGQSTYTRQWGPVKTYGGKLFENIVQAVACDQFAEAMPLMEAAGYEAILGIHDEWVAETPDTEEFTAAGLAATMTSDLGWNAGLPLAAAGFETDRYHKE